MNEIEKEARRWYDERRNIYIFVEDRKIATDAFIAGAKYTEKRYAELLHLISELMEKLEVRKR